MIIQASVLASSAPKASGQIALPNSTATKADTQENDSGTSQFTSSGLDLSTLIAQVTILAASTSTDKTTPTSSPPISTAKVLSGTGKDSDAGTSSAQNSPPSIVSGPDLSTMIAQASFLASNLQSTSASTASPTSAAKISPQTGKDSSAGTTSASILPQLGAGGSDLSTRIAQALGQASSTQPASVSTAPVNPAVTTTADLGNKIPLSGLNTAPTGSASKEKKSASTSAEGSFLQSETSSTSAASTFSSTAASLLTYASELSGSQQVASPNGSNNSSSTNLSTSTPTVAGTANVEQGKAMNADLNFPELEALSGYGVTAPAQQNAPDMSILLGSNNDFQDALKQVMHVAQLTQTNQSLAPMRVEMEIQTPPGAIVNVYVSRQNDQWRAQLSTNDPQALSWVQDQMSSLRQTNNLGVEVRWLPPQMETGSTNLASSGGQDSNLAWDRGGQGQSNYQQPDERQQSERQKRAGILPELAAIGSNPFMTTITELGRAA